MPEGACLFREETTTYKTAYVTQGIVARRLTWHKLGAFCRVYWCCGPIEEQDFSITVTT